MTAERAEAYGRLMRSIRDRRSVDLLPLEEDQLREAADVLLFCERVEADATAREAIATAQRLLDGLVQVDRLDEPSARRLLGELEACGPLAPVA